MDPEPRTVFFACSSGGHIDLLERVLEGADGWRVHWVTQPSQRAHSLERRGQRVSFLPEYDRNVLRGRLVLTILRSLVLALRYRPGTVVTSGSGLIVAFCVFSRLLGARVIFVETSARVTSPSHAGRVLSRLATTTLVQWESMKHVYPRTRLCRPSVLDQVSTDRSVRGTGTFVGVGTHIYAFDRLLRKVDSALAEGTLPRPVVAQTGVSTWRPEHFDAVDWMTPETIETAILSSRYVVCHAGSGLVSTALSTGRRPIVMARRRALGEHFDDHQSQIVAELAAMDLIVPIVDELTPEHLAHADRPLTDPRRASPTCSIAAALYEELAALERT